MHNPAISRQKRVVRIETRHSKSRNRQCVCVRQPMHACMHACELVRDIMAIPGHEVAQASTHMERHRPGRTVRVRI
jgi:hypothetical protein